MTKKQDAKTNIQKATANDVAIVRIAERAKAVKLFFVLFFAGFCFYQTRLGWESYLKSKDETTAIERTINTILTAVISSSIPVGVGVSFFWKIRRFTARLTSRIAKIELQVDPERTSSGLKDDGTDQPEIKL